VTSNLRHYGVLLLITVSALFIHGYHPGAEDGEIYLPAIKKILNPALYPFGAEFFLNHAHLTLFDEFIAASVRASHLSFDLVIFLWYGLSTFLMLFACWQLSSEVFPEPEAQWSGVMLVAALLTIPVAGTSLYIADQYLTSRSIVTFAVLFAITNAWKGNKVMFVVWSVIAVCIHPLMAVFGISYAAMLWLVKRGGSSFFQASYLLSPIGIALPNLVPPTSDAYRVAAATRPYFFLFQWRWSELIGAIAPLVILWLIARYSEKHALGKLRVMSLALMVYGAVYFLIAAVTSNPRRFLSIARFQPMRSLHVVYIIMFLFGGGLLGRSFLQRRVFRWIIVFMPVCCVMFFAQRQLFPASPHIEWPLAAPKNDWLAAFDWIRQNTPADAIFAMDPDYMLKDDQHGFRALAERSRLADAVKDSGAASMFPDRQTAAHWLEQLNAQRNWQHFREIDFERLKRLYCVTWVVLDNPVTVDLKCPYENATLSVCKLN
jgi:hypothetical protein